MISDNFGEMNAYALGIFMKEMVRRAILAIRRERFSFEEQAKIGRTGKLDDLVTSADRAAQEIYIKMIRKGLPGFGIVAEENELAVPCTLGTGESVFTVDPLDGTKAFKRRQSHGIGTMLSLIRNGDVIAAYVGDINTQEIYGFRPGAATVHRISEYDYAEELTVDKARTLTDQYLMDRDTGHDGTPLSRLLHSKDAARCRGFETTNGSLGIAAARLWKSEVGGMVLEPSKYAPWDWYPIAGISCRLGFVFLQFDNGSLRRFTIPTGPNPVCVDSEILVVHESRLAELEPLIAA